jgi:hypothetical protein
MPRPAVERRGHAIDKGSVKPIGEIVSGTFHQKLNSTMSKTTKRQRRVIRTEIKLHPGEYHKLKRAAEDSGMYTRQWVRTMLIQLADNIQPKQKEYA